MDVESKVYEILKKKRYNRDEPHLEEKIKERIFLFIKENKPIKLVGFWGVGPKNKANWADEASCEFLAELNDSIKQIYPLGLDFIFIFATSHGIHNGIDKVIIQSYTEDIIKLFKKFGFKYHYLDDFWRKYNISFEEIDKIFQQKPKDWWGKIENSKLIEKNAKKRNQRLPPRIGAQKYYIMRDLEKEMLEREFPDSIFHAFSDSKLKNVLPNMPTLYFYSRKGWSDTPWFITKNDPLSHRPLL